MSKEAKGYDLETVIHLASGVGCNDMQVRPIERGQGTIYCLKDSNPCFLVKRRNCPKGLTIKNLEHHSPYIRFLRNKS